MPIPAKKSVSNLNAADCDLDQLTVNHYHYLLSYANYRTRNSETAKDLVQESFLAALEHRDNFENRCSERSWLVTILKNKIIDHYRKKDVEERNITMLNYAASYEMQPAHHDFLPLLNKAVQKLPKLWQTVFKMKHLNDEPTANICRELQLTPANYWVISHRTRLSLRASLGKHI